jgi:ubiquinol-cytochrome c reductase cytochrome b subunit
MLTAPFIVIAILFAVPFISNTGEKSPRRRPVAVLTVLFILVVLGAFNYLGTYAPWSPKMEAWTSAATPPNYLERRSPLERQGALVFHNKQCINCHSIGTEGGLRGPALDSVATRLTGDQLVRQVIQGSGNMPAYGKNLSPPEVAALVAFMSTLHKPTEAPARDATRPTQAAAGDTQPNATAQIASRKP